MPDQGQVHTGRLPADHTLGARGRARHGSGTSGRSARGRAPATSNRRTRVRDVEGLDGLKPLPDENVATRAYRDQPAGPGLQLEAGDEDPWNPGTDECNEGVDRKTFATSTP